VIFFNGFIDIYWRMRHCSGSGDGVVAKEGFGGNQVVDGYVD